MMKIPFGTVTLPYRSKQLVMKALNDKRLSSGKLVREFEKRFAALVGTKEAVAVSTGTDADALSLAVLYDLGAKRWDEVVMPALSFVSTGNAVLQAGFKPVFVDIELETLNINPALINKAITKNTKAIMPVHLMGKPAAMAEINAIAKKHKLLVIGDAAEAHGAIYKGKNVGSIGDMAAYSLYVAHIITTVEGGIVTTNSLNFAQILRSLRSHGRACSCESCVINTASAYCPKRFTGKNDSDIRFRFDRIGFSSKMNELEAAVGLGNLSLYDKILNKRRENLYYLIKKFKRFEDSMFTLTKEKNEEIGPHAFPFVIRKEAPFSRDLLMNYLEKHGIDARTLFSSIPTQCAGFSFLKAKIGDFPNAEFIGTHGLHIGVHQDLSKKECDYFIKVIEKFLLSL